MHSRPVPSLLASHCSRRPTDSKMLVRTLDRGRPPLRILLFAPLSRFRLCAKLLVAGRAVRTLKLDRESHPLVQHTCSVRRIRVVRSIPTAVDRRIATTLLRRLFHQNKVLVSPSPISKLLAHKLRVPFKTFIGSATLHHSVTRGDASERREPTDISAAHQDP